MSNIKPTQGPQELVSVFKKNIGDNLFALISVGSLTTKHYIKSWSDIDLVVVFEQLSLKDKVIVSKLKSELEQVHGRKFGINIITKRESISPILPTISLDGKTLQGLLDLSIHPGRLLYCKDNNTQFYTPDTQTIREYSILNIFMFLRRNRKSLTSELASTNLELKNITEREIRASFIMTKLAIQYIKGLNCNGYKEISETAKELFFDFDVNTLLSLEQAMNKWDKVTNQEEIGKLLTETDAYIESFSEYVLKII